MKGQSLAEALKSIFVLAVIVLCLVAGYLIWSQIMGNPINFEGGNPEGAALPGNYLGIIYKGGFIVPLLMAVNLILITFVIERFIMLWKAKGHGNVTNFIRRLQALLN
jgi:biopolymer transport protein ExbB